MPETLVHKDIYLNWSPYNLAYSALAGQNGTFNSWTWRINSALYRTQYSECNTIHLFKVRVRFFVWKNLLLLPVHFSVIAGGCLLIWSSLWAAFLILIICYVESTNRWYSVHIDLHLGSWLMSDLKSGLIQSKSMTNIDSFFWSVLYVYSTLIFYLDRNVCTLLRTRFDVCMTGHLRYNDINNQIDATITIH